VLNYDLHKINKQRKIKKLLAQFDPKGFGGNKFIIKKKTRTFVNIHKPVSMAELGRYTSVSAPRRASIHG